MADALYLMNIDKFISLCDKILDVEKKRNKIVKAFVISNLYGYNDYAIELLVRSKGLFEDKDYNSLMKDLRKSVMLSERIPYFKGKFFIHNLIKGFANLFQSSYNGAFHRDGILGNRKLF